MIFSFSNLVFVPFQWCAPGSPQPGAPELTPALYEACKRSVHVLLPDGTVLQHAPACLYILEHSSFPAPLRWLALRVAGLPLVMPLLNLGYTFVASHRRPVSRIFHRLFWSGARDTEAQPSPWVPSVAEIRARSAERGSCALPTHQGGSGGD